MAVREAHTVDDVLQAIQRELENLSARLKQAGTYVLEHPNDVALQSITALAKNADVQPSVFMRLSKHFGFSGFTDFQKVFRAALADQSPTYGERIKHLQRDFPDAGVASQPVDFVREFAAINTDALSHLATSIDEKAINEFVRRLKEATEIFILGQRRSHAVANYLSYALMRANLRTRLMLGAGGTLHDEIRLMRKGDLLVAVSMHPYSNEVLELVDHARNSGHDVIALTDSNYSPLAKRANTSIVVRDVHYLGFRSLVAQVCLVQAIAISIAAAAAKADS
ncbi:MurR/RpiR family transcriptional regulator [Mesorhizobium sp. SP-1A]|uniref:MurR/RpiR family transcriptional regulator n=1 Tax=Mesorhizobium sp. SP-1A TaxID=3077840 RepID=UPI0028F745D4|nr:MurR/RpiR family transcriptional regulator [Mesorhizobium sp. SP-1A]